MKGVNCLSLTMPLAAGDSQIGLRSAARPSYETIPDSYLTSPACDWESFFLNDVQRIIDGTWTGTNQWLGMEDGLVSLCDMHNLADGTEEKVQAAIDGFTNGTLDIWTGEILDNEGNVAVAEGETLSDADLLSLSWFVDGVNGSVN